MDENKSNETTVDETNEQNEQGTQSKEQDAATNGTEDGTLDKHGQPGINKERHDREVAELNKKIEELQKLIDDGAETKKERDELKQQIADVRADLDNERLTSKLEKAGCIDIDVAKAIIGTFDGDVEKLKESKPFLFEIKKKGATGGKPEGAADGKDDLEQKFRAAAGLRKRK